MAIVRLYANEHSTRHPEYVVIFEDQDEADAWDEEEGDSDWKMKDEFEVDHRVSSWPTARELTEN